MLPLLPVLLKNWVLKEKTKKRNLSPRMHLLQKPRTTMRKSPRSKKAFYIIVWVFVDKFEAWVSWWPNTWYYSFEYSVFCVFGFVWCLGLNWCGRSWNLSSFLLWSYCLYFKILKRVHYPENSWSIYIISNPWNLCHKESKFPCQPGQQGSSPTQPSLVSYYTHCTDEWWFSTTQAIDQVLLQIYRIWAKKPTNTQAYTPPTSPNY